LAPLRQKVFVRSNLENPLEERADRISSACPVGDTTNRI
jgi:hypothetical protein